jgi:hypothetical protein
LKCGHPFHTWCVYTLCQTTRVEENKLKCPVCKVTGEECDSRAHALMQGGGSVRSHVSAHHSDDEVDLTSASSGLTPAVPGGIQPPSVTKRRSRSSSRGDAPINVARDEEPINVPPKAKARVAPPIPVGGEEPESYRQNFWEKYRVPPPAGRWRTNTSAVPVDGDVLAELDAVFDDVGGGDGGDDDVGSDRRSNGDVEHATDGEDGGDEDGGDEEGGDDPATATPAAPTPAPKRKRGAKSATAGSPKPKPRAAKAKAEAKPKVQPKRGAKAQPKSTEAPIVKASPAAKPAAKAQPKPKPSAKATPKPKAKVDPTAVATSDAIVPASDGVDDGEEVGR